MKKSLKLWAVLCCLIFKLNAQEYGKIQGKISAGGQPLAFASIQILGTQLGTTSDEQGNYLLEQVPFGKQTLKTNLIGYQQHTHKVFVEAHQIHTVDFSLEEDNLGLNEVVVSATRYERSREEAPVVVHVLGSKLFNATQSITLSEGLNYKPGVRVETNCQNCGFTQVRLNGLEGAYSQILINSRAIFSALNSVYGLDQIPTNMVERVEIVRSGGSALFGSNAIAGTINIITKEPVENTWQVGSNFALIDGSELDHTLNFDASLVNEELNTGITLYGMYRDRDAYDANEDGFTEITRLENNTFGAKAFLKPSDYSKLSLDFSFIREYRRGGDRLNLAPHLTDITEELDHNTLIAGLTYDQFTKSRESKFSTYISVQTTQRDSYYGGLGGGRTTADSLLALNAYGNTKDLALVGGVQFTHYFASEDVLTLGIENQFSDVQDDIPGYNRLIDQQVHTLGLYGQYEWTITDRWKALLGARFDRTRVDGLYDIGNIRRQTEVQTSVFSPRLTMLYDISPSLQFRGGYARGFRAPQAFDEDLHISSVGGEPQFVILADDLEKELSDAFTASLNFTRNLGRVQTNFLVEGFYTNLKNPFTIVSTGSVLANGSILEEVRNGQQASVAGINFEASLSPSSAFSFQAGGTWQKSRYQETQILFEPENPNELETIVSTDEFVRNPNLYGYITSYWNPLKNFNLDLTGTFTGKMVVPRVVSASGFLDLVESNPFWDMNLKLSYHFDIQSGFQLEFSGGLQNIFNSYQGDFDTGPSRDSDYIYGPARPRTFFIGIKLRNFQ